LPDLHRRRCNGAGITGVAQGRFQAVFLSKKGLQPSIYLRWQLLNA
jgi:hypothetical protein